jgi:hypothetical protein
MRPVSRISLVSLTVFVVALLHAGGGLAGGTASTLYVKKSGSDSAACTAAAPCLTINHAVSVAAAGDTIQVGPGKFNEFYTVEINKNLTIKGFAWFSTLVSQWPSWTYYPVFRIGSDATVTLFGMTIAGGTEGGVHNDGHLTLQGVQIWGNTGGPGVYNETTGVLTMTNVGVDRTAGASGLENWGTATVSFSHFNGSQVVVGPAAGIENGGMLTVDRGLIAGNQGPGLDAVHLSTLPSCATTVLTNVTITANSYGGVEAWCGSTTLTHVTIAGNTSGGVNAGATGVPVHSIVVRNSIVAKNSGEQCAGDVKNITYSLKISYSLLGDNSCFSWPSPDNLVGVDPKLTGLTYAGVGDFQSWLFLIGRPRVLALQPGSPAIDTAGDAWCTPTDQLGQPRPAGAGCDMGAYEYQPSGGGAPTR